MRRRHWKPDTDLEGEIAELLDQETFDPPAEFAEKALWNDESRLRGGRADPRGVLGRAGRGARLVRAVGHGARRLRGAVLQVVHRRQAERLLQLPRPPRRGRPRRPRRLPLARRGGRGARRHLRRPAPRRPAAGQRAQGPRHRPGRRGRDLPADDPRGRRRDARLRADRRAAQRGLRRLLAGLGEGADGVLRGQGADHRRRRAPQGQDGAGQARGRRLPRRPAVDRDGRRGAATPATTCEMDRSATSGSTRRSRRPTPTARPSRSTPSTRCSCSTPRARPPSRRASCTPPAAT